MRNLSLAYTLSANSDLPEIHTRSIVSGVERLEVDFDTVAKLATEVLRDVMKFRRIVTPDSSCDIATCRLCHAPHLNKVVSAIMQREPIAFVLPAFPGKSPNQAKVLGTLPDMAEQRALAFLNGLCDRIKKIYSPGARIILCSDGRVFSDVIGMNESDVTAYQNELDRMIREHRLTNLSTFNLDELCGERDFVQMRIDLMEKYGDSLESQRARISRGGKDSENPEDQESHRMYCGITRFLFEDSLHPGQTKSRTAIQKDSRARAYEVIRRSNAWSELIAERFPNAVRMSIHPQTCGSAKLGIQLLGTESWMTPWHGVAVDIDDEFVLMKRWEVEKLDAELICDKEGRPSHYRMMAQKKLTPVEGT